MKTNMGRGGFSLPFGPFGRLKSPLPVVKNSNPPPLLKGGEGVFEVCKLRFCFSAMRSALCSLRYW